MNYAEQDPFKEYSTVIRDLSGVAFQIARVEERKTEAASVRRHELLDGCIQEEQALLLKLRGLEQHRISSQKALGWEGLTLSQILEKASSEQLELLAPLFEELKQQIERLLQARNAAERIINVRLHEMKVIASQQQGTAYDSGGNTNPAAASHARIHNKYV
ncbi:MAG: flagellar protein FlgN [Lachnospiraceae bacterium]